jgi:hypothetical protein
MGWLWLLYPLIGLVLAAPVARGTTGLFGDRDDFGDRVLFHLFIGIMAVLVAALWPVVVLGWVYWQIIKPRKGLADNEAL